MHLSDGIYAYFIIIDAKAHFVATRKHERSGDEASIYLKELNESFTFHPNWEAVGASVYLEFRGDRNTARAYVSGEILYDYKKKMRPKVLELAKKFYPATSFEWNELPKGSFDHLNNHMTFVRDHDGSWKQGEVPVERAIFASNKQSRSVQPLGRPGGPCQIIHNIENAGLPDKIKEDMKKDIHLGDDLDNADASKIYEDKTVQLGGGLIPKVSLSNHAQYRMDLRSVTVDSLKSAFYEFEKWFKHKKRNKRDVSLDDMDKLERLVNGQSIRFEARKIGLTIIFRVTRDKSAHLISAWWQGRPNPKPPKPGECRIGASMNGELKSIISDLRMVSSSLPVIACGDCDCSGCASKKDKGSWYEPHQHEEVDENWYEASKWDDAYTDGDKWEEDEEGTDDEWDDEDDETVDGRRRVRQRSKSKNYRKRRRRNRRNPGKRRRRNRKRRRKNRRPSQKAKRKRYRRRTKNRPRSRRRSPKSY